MERFWRLERGDVGSSHTGRRLLLAATSLALGGCGHAPSASHATSDPDVLHMVGVSGPRWGSPAVRQAARDALRDSLRAGMRRWEAVGRTSYRYREEMRCFCIPPAPIVVEVTAGVVTAVLDTLGRPAPPYEGYPRTGVTVPERFARLERAIDDTMGGVRAAFHPELGYPLRVFTDSPTMSDVHLEQRVVWLTFREDTEQ